MRIEILEEHEDATKIMYKLKAVEFGPDCKVTVSPELTLDYDRNDGQAYICRHHDTPKKYVWTIWVTSPIGHCYSYHVDRDHSNLGDTSYGPNVYKGRRFPCNLDHVFVYAIGRKPFVVPDFQDPFAVDQGPYPLEPEDDYTNFQVVILPCGVDGVACEELTRRPTCVINTHLQVLRTIPCLKRLVDFSEGTHGRIEIQSNVSEKAARAWIKSTYAGILDMTWDTLQDLWILCDRYMTFDRLHKRRTLTILKDLIQKVPQDVTDIQKEYWLRWMDTFISDSEGSHRQEVAYAQQLFTEAFDETTYTRLVVHCPKVMQILVKTMSLHF